VRGGGDQATVEQHVDPGGAVWLGMTSFDHHFLRPAILLRRMSVNAVERSRLKWLLMISSGRSTDRSLVSIWRLAPGLEGRMFERFTDQARRVDVLARWTGAPGQSTSQRSCGVRMGCAGGTEGNEFCEFTV
jgi:hypothetical protein